ncbi:PIN domain-containing protein [Aliivibrio fischeri]|uniref:PIN domain-containing protein n=1 Tax=Aliivibrio fischeri TaxID=668 RepID=UPI0012D8A7E3|nr:PIN domain-containing protein [Aliivibrio fischeri]MUI54401.1 hypothetical protein [Aliivibrio fischeri]
MMDLVSRLVFVDTSAYEQKNYQFGEHALGRLQELVEGEKITLLITDVTKSEIQSHLKKLSQDAAAKLKKIQKEAMFLRNTPDLPCYGIFTKQSSDSIYEIVNDKFLELIEGDCVEEISIGTVDPKIVFANYFDKKAPFSNDAKKYEFPDAFALEAIRNIADARQQKIYIISSDSDMKSYADSFENLIYLSSIDEIIDSVIRHDVDLAEPAKFADSNFITLQDEILERVQSYLEGSEFYSDVIDNWEDEIVEVNITEIEIEHKSLLDVTTDEAKYEVVFKCNLTVEYSIADYDRSPWDSEDKAYAFVLQNSIIKEHVEKYSAYVDISFENALKVNCHLEDIDFIDARFELLEQNASISSYKELDINGD